MSELPVRYCCAVCGRTLIGELAWSVHRKGHEEVEFEAARIVRWVVRA